MPHWLHLTGCQGNSQLRRTSAETGFEAGLAGAQYFLCAQRTQSLPRGNFVSSAHFCARDFASTAVNKRDSGLVEWEIDFGRWFQKQLPGHPDALVQIWVSGCEARATALVNLGNFFRLDPEHQHRLSSSSIALQLPLARLPSPHRDTVLSRQVP